ncbi:PLC-like phosphodiesterase [Truncatella angustata]|uniref:PLC-like phosphodiesterase n=1 Tax=Truncatella angustata TaxID=152316 RepID=A0A9P8UHM6_9PEZI|nr:PLC-like phosphodiesterase [Truncatella angustata]KAH6652389.1 PLC-like phosphodiesterase [Truncatella angustata]
MILSGLAYRRRIERKPVLAFLNRHLGRPAVTMDSTLPLAPFASRQARARGLPQAIAHRGYKARFPENTLAAFRGAVEVGAHAIETDLHLSRDGVVVLSHDATLKRCFGDPSRIADHDWEHLSTFRSLREPREPIARLVDLLEYVAKPEQKHIWLLLDIKTDDDISEMFTSLAAALASVPTDVPWNQRIILGLWTVEWVAACLRTLAEFPMSLIAWSPSLVSALLPVPNLNFTMFNYSFATPSGSRLRQQAKQRSRLVFSWTDNADEWMVSSIRNEIDGVVTDDPKRLLELCDQKSPKAAQEVKSIITAKETILWVVGNFLVLATEIVLWFTKGSPRSQVKKTLGV